MAEILRTARLILRTWSERDAEAAFRIYGDAEAMRYVGPGKPLSDLAQMRKYLLWMTLHQGRRGYAPWAAEEAASGELVGACGFVWQDATREHEILYHFRRDRWGMGYATEAAGAALAHGLGPLGFHRVMALAYPENLPSQRVLGKIGMRRIGRATYFGLELLKFEAQAPAPRREAKAR